MKTLSERIAARAQQMSSASTAARNRSVFLSLREDIQKAHADGWSLLAIWQTLFDEQRVSFTYQAFRRYARKLIDSPTASERSARPPQRKPAPNQKQGIAMGTFTFNPSPPKEQLL
ncbi:TraK family protein [Metapseudomonas furukawaii]|uniref:TraK family protein n=1 Tax=Metapseudomonas furukawaii TaxID=1149133 RepID=UPI0040453FDF